MNLHDLFCNLHDMSVPGITKTNEWCWQVTETPAPPQSEHFQISKIEQLHHLARIKHGLARL